MGCQPHALHQYANLDVAADDVHALEEHILRGCTRCLQELKEIEPFGPTLHAGLHHKLATLAGPIDAKEETVTPLRPATVVGEGPERGASPRPMTATFLRAELRELARHLAADCVFELLKSTHSAVLVTSITLSIGAASEFSKSVGLLGVTYLLMSVACLFLVGRLHR